MAIKTHTFNGTKYDIELEIDYLGRCDEPNPKRGTVFVDTKGLSGVKLLEVFIHEGLHASNWKAKEGVVDRTARDIARFIYRCGYKLK